LGSWEPPETPSWSKAGGDQGAQTHRHTPVPGFGVGEGDAAIHQSTFTGLEPRRWEAESCKPTWCWRLIPIPALLRGNCCFSSPPALEIRRSSAAHRDTVSLQGSFTWELQKTQ